MIDEKTLDLATFGVAVEVACALNVPVRLILRSWAEGALADRGVERVRAAYLNLGGIDGCP